MWAWTVSIRETYCSGKLGTGTTNHLVGDKQGGLEGELAAAVCEEIFEAGAQQLHREDIVLSFDAEPIDRRKARYIALGWLSYVRPQTA